MSLFIFILLLIAVPPSMSAMLHANAPIVQVPLILEVLFNQLLSVVNLSHFLNSRDAFMNSFSAVYSLAVNPADGYYSHDNAQAVFVLLDHFKKLSIEKNIHLKPQLTSMISLIKSRVRCDIDLLGALSALPRKRTKRLLYLISMCTLDPSGAVDPIMSIQEDARMTFELGDKLMIFADENPIVLPNVSRWLKLRILSVHFVVTAFMEIFTLNSERLLAVIKEYGWKFSKTARHSFVLVSSPIWVEVRLFEPEIAHNLDTCILNQLYSYRKGFLLDYPQFNFTSTVSLPPLSIKPFKYKKTPRWNPQITLQSPYDDIMTLLTAISDYRAPSALPIAVLVHSMLFQISSHLSYFDTFINTSTGSETTDQTSFRRCLVEVCDVLGKGIISRSLCMDVLSTVNMIIRFKVQSRYSDKVHFPDIDSFDRPRRVDLLFQRIVQRGLVCPQDAQVCKRLLVHQLNIARRWQLPTSDPQKDLNLVSLLTAVI